MKRGEATWILIFGVIGLVLGPLVGIFAWHAWRGEPVDGIAHIASLFWF